MIYTPIWATDVMDKVTGQLVPEWDDLKQLRSTGNLLIGVETSDCPKPCTTTTSYIRMIADLPVNVTGMTLSFPKEIMILKTEMITFTYVTFLSMLGGNLGLWLGFGFFQFLEIFVTHFIFKKWNQSCLTSHARQ